MLHIFIETEEQMSNHEQISLLIPEEVEHRINERRILREDIQKTIHHAETTGEKFINAINGRFLTSMRRIGSPSGWNTFRSEMPIKFIAPIPTEWK